MGQQVLIFTASGTFSGQRGEVIERTRAGVQVRLEDGDKMFFKSSELTLIPAEEPVLPMVAGD